MRTRSPAWMRPGWAWNWWFSGNFAIRAWKPGNPKCLAMLDSVSPDYTVSNTFYDGTGFTGLAGLAGAAGLTA